MISLCIIMKNEEKFIQTALQSVKSIMGLSDLVVVDTGSTDKSKEIASANGARVFDFEWCDDFSAARNFAAQQAEFDWIFALDADEEVKESSITQTTLNDINIIGSAVRHELENDAHTQKAILYNRRAYRFCGSIHEQIEPFVGCAQFKSIPVLIAHHGYLPEHNKIDGKLSRNEKLLKKELAKTPNDPYLMYQLGKSYFCGNRDLAKACKYFEQALSLNPNHMLDYVYNLTECYGYALINTGQYDKALEFLDQYENHYKSNPAFRFLAGNIFLNKGMFSDALDCFESCIGADCTDFRGITSYMSYYNIGVILEVAGMPQDAERLYKKCGDYPPAKERLARL